MALNDETKVVVLLLPFPVQGHLNPFLQLSHLIAAQNIAVHYVGTVTHIRQAKLRYHNATSNIHFHAFEVPPYVSPPPNPEDDFPSHLIPSFEASAHLREPVGKLLQSLSSQAKRVVLINDSLMASVAQDAANFSNVERYCFQVFSALNTADFHFPDIPSLQGCISAQFTDFLTAQNEFRKFNNGDIYNTSRVIEGPYVELLERFNGGKEVWALGPFTPLAVEKKDSIGFSHPCMEWLDKQEPSSVIYVSFGTTTALRDEQIQELATGLEQSKQKFIWVLRDADKGDIFDGSEAKGMNFQRVLRREWKEWGWL
ncbi:hypothetical protein ACSQ67_015705 [Phaseolus vulgaris]